MSLKISIIIPTWNGRHLLERYLPFIYEARKRCYVSSELIIVDDCSADGTADYLNNYYPDAVVVKCTRNKRFAGANNAGAKVAKGNILIFLNNDVEVTSSFLEPLLKHFNEPDIFAVGCNIMMRGIRKETGLTKGFFRKGFIQIEHSREEYAKAVPILYGCGCAFACRKDKFMEIKGFSAIYEPFYWEDTDISYRAWKRGWKTFFEPNSVVYHIHQATNNAANFSRNFLSLIKERNRYLFFWKNISQLKYVLFHLGWLVVIGPWNILQLKFIKIAAFFLALIRLPTAIYHNIKDEKYRKLDDKEILRMTADSLYSKKYYSHKIMVKKERLNILYICPYLPLTGISAGSGRMFELIKRLSKRHTVDVISFIIDEELKYLAPLKCICNRVDVVRRNYPWQRDSLLLIPSMIDEFYAKEMENLIKRRLYEEDYNIVQFEYLHMSQYAPNFYTGKLILTEHQLHFLSRRRDSLNTASYMKKIESFFSFLKGKIYEINACKKFDKIITVTEGERDILKDYLPYLDVEAVHTGVDTSFFCPNHRLKENIDILYLGFFRHYPNVDAVLYFYNHIYPLIKEKLPEVTFNIVGFGPPEEILRMQRNNGIKVTGYVQDITSYLEDSKVFIMPIRLGMGIRGKLLEAWAMRRAVVSTSIGCAGIQVEDGNDVLIADKPIDFAEKTIELIRNESLRRRLGENGRRKAVSLYDWDIVADKLEGIYRGLI